MVTEDPATLAMLPFQGKHLFNISGYTYCSSTPAPLKEEFMADTPFEIPQTVRDRAEQNVKQAHAAYAQLMDFVTKTMDAWMGAMPSPVAARFKDVQALAMEFAKENAESMFTFAGKISNAQTFQEIFTLQTQFTQDRMQAFVTQTQELHKLIAETVQKLQRG